MVGLVKPANRTSGSTDTFPLGEKILRAGIEQRAKGWMLRPSAER